jgi:HAD superfamily hydrolase (TIGR01509 family)
MIKALVFDFDGLIIDTESPDFDSWQETFAAHGCELTLETWADCIGRASGAFNPAEHLENQLGRPLDRPALRAARQQRFYEILARETLRPGVEEYLQDARRLGLKTAVASSATRDWVVCHLARFDALQHFDCIRCFDDGGRSKPEPDLYLATVRELGVRPEEAIAFEDSPNGLLAARRAGLYCVAVPNSVTARLPLENADLVLESLADLPLEELIARAEGRAPVD